MIVFHQIESKNRTANDVRLPHFQSVDACKNVYCVGTKDSEHTHIKQVKQMKLEKSAFGIRINCYEIAQNVTKFGRMIILPKKLCKERQFVQYNLSGHFTNHFLEQRPIFSAGIINTNTFQVILV